VEQSFRLRRRHIQFSGQLLVGHPFHGAKDQNAGVQRLHATKSTHQLDAVRDEDLGTVLTVRYSGSFVESDRNYATRATPDLIYTDVRGDTGEPSAHLMVTLQTGQTGEAPQERLLRSLVDVLTIAKQPPTDASYARHVPTVKLLVGAPLSRTESEYQITIAHLMRRALRHGARG
jgi:hypothetical protein